MFQLAGEKQTSALLAYFEQDLKNCLYGYIDLKKYGLRNPHLRVYYSTREDRITAVATEYHKGIQLFSYREELDIEETLELIQRLRTPMINGKQKAIGLLEPFLREEFDMETGFVSWMKAVPGPGVGQPGKAGARQPGQGAGWTGEMRAGQPGKAGPGVGQLGQGAGRTGAGEQAGDRAGEEPHSQVECSREEDFLEIARLVCSDEGLGGHYTPEEFAGQLLERKKENFGRSYLIRRDGKIVSHAATYAEIDNLAVVSGVITRPEYRGLGLGYETVSKLCQDLLQEGKRPCLFYFKEEAIRLYAKVGFEEGTLWGKLSRRHEI